MVLCVVGSARGGIREIEFQPAPFCGLQTFAYGARGWGFWRAIVAVRVDAIEGFEVAPAAWQDQASSDTDATVDLRQPRRNSRLRIRERFARIPAGRRAGRG